MAAPLTDAAVRAMQTRAERASEPPWEASRRERPKDGGAWLWNFFVAVPGAGTKADEQFLRHARTDIPALATALQEARAALREAMEYANRKDMASWRRALGEGA